jgi:hypothetical protein
MNVQTSNMQLLQDASVAPEPGSQCSITKLSNYTYPFQKVNDSSILLLRLLQVWAVVVLSREVSTQGTTIANTNPALVDKSGATLRTTGGVINLIDMPLNASAAAESFASVPLNSTVFGRRLLQAGSGMAVALLAPFFLFSYFDPILVPFFS